MGTVKAQEMLTADVLSVAIKDEKIIHRQRILISVLSVMCAILAVFNHGKKHT